MRPRSLPSLDRPASPRCLSGRYLAVRLHRRGLHPDPRRGDRCPRSGRGPGVQGVGLAAATVDPTARADAAWPGPVWGAGTARPYGQDALAAAVTPALLGSTGGPKVTPIGRLLGVGDARAMAGSFRRLAALPGLRRLVPSHGKISSGSPSTTPLSSVTPNVAARPPLKWMRRPRCPSAPPTAGRAGC